MYIKNLVDFNNYKSYCKYFGISPSQFESLKSYYQFIGAKL